VNKKIHLVFPWLGGSFILGMVFFPLPLFSSSTTVYSTVELPDPLEDVGHSPRGAAMASAYTAAEGLADSLYWNPAGLSTILSPQISMIHQAWYSGFFRENFISAFPIPHTGAFGVGADYTGYGTFPLFPFHWMGRPADTAPGHRLGRHRAVGFPIFGLSPPFGLCFWWNSLERVETLSGRGLLLFPEFGRFGGHGPLENRRFLVHRTL
jgi:hypothetical protein